MHGELGFNLEVGKDELEKHLSRRIAFHQGREKFYLDRSKEFEGDREKIENGHSNRRMGTHQEEMEQSARVHADTAKYFRFVLDHLPAKKTLGLTQSALTTLELLE